MEGGGCTQGQRPLIATPTPTPAQPQPTPQHKSNTHTHLRACVLRQHRQIAGTSSKKKVNPLSTTHTPGMKDSMGKRWGRSAAKGRVKKARACRQAGRG